MKNKKIVLFKKLIDDQKNNFLNLSNLQIENLVSHQEILSLT